MDRGGWQATVHEVTKSQTCLSDLTLSLFTGEWQSQASQEPGLLHELVHLLWWGFHCQCHLAVQCFSVVEGILWFTGKRLLPARWCCGRIPLLVLPSCLVSLWRGGEYVAQQVGECSPWMLVGLLIHPPPGASGSAYWCQDHSSIQASSHIFITLQAQQDLDPACIFTFVDHHCPPK